MIIFAPTGRRHTHSLAALAAAALTASAPAGAAEIDFIGASGASWHSRFAWSAFAIPGADDDARFLRDEAYRVRLSRDAQAFQLVQEAGVIDFDLAGSTLTASGISLPRDFSPSGVASLNFRDGTVRTRSVQFRRNGLSIQNGLWEHESSQLRGSASTDVYLREGGVARILGDTNPIGAPRFSAEVAGAGARLEITGGDYQVVQENSFGETALRVAGGGVVEVEGNLTVINRAAVLVEGVGTRVSARSTAVGTTPLTGFDDAGSYTIRGGATAVDRFATSVAAGTEAFEFARFRVEGVGTRFASGGLDIGSDGAGAASASILDGGVFEASGAVRVGARFREGGLIDVRGAGSRLEAGGRLTVGSVLDGPAAGSSVLRIGTGAEVAVSAASGPGNVRVDRSGLLDIDGGTLRLAAGGTLTGGGEVRFSTGEVAFDGDAAPETAVLNRLLGAGRTLGDGRALTVEGEADFGGTVRLGGGTLSVGSLADPGSVVFDRGRLALTAGGFNVGGGGTLGADVALTNGQTLSVGVASIDADAGLLITGGTLEAASVLNRGETRLGGGLVGGVVVAGGFTNAGLLGGDGRVAGQLVNAAEGVVRITTAERLRFTGEGHSNGGRVELLGGTLELDGAFVNLTGGRVLGRGSLVAGSVQNAGSVEFSGVADVVGAVTNDAAGVIRVRGGGPVTFFDDVDNAGEVRTDAGSAAVFLGELTGAGAFTGPGVVRVEGTLAPGNSPGRVAFGGGLELTDTSTLAIEIGGLTAGTQHDVVAVGGALTLAGSLEVSLLGGFAPAFGDAFSVLDFGPGGASGRFDGVTLPALAGSLAWDASSLASDGTLRVVPEPGTAALLAAASLWLLRRRAA